MCFCLIVIDCECRQCVQLYGVVCGVRLACVFYNWCVLMGANNEYSEG